MNKKFLFLALFLFVASFALHADDEPATPAADVPQLKSATGQLVNLDLNRAMQRIDSLERDVNDLERDNRYQDERIRMLERSLNDIRREIRT